MLDLGVYKPSGEEIEYAVGYTRLEFRKRAWAGNTMSIVNV